MAQKLWSKAGLVTAIGSAILVALAAGTIVQAAVTDPIVPNGGGRAHAGAGSDGTAARKATDRHQSATIGDTTFSVTGIDVSSHDHTNFDIDWAAVAASGVDFAYVKATEGTPPDPYVNPYFASDFQAAKANGLYAGAYAFGRPDLDPIGQADVLIDRSGWSPDSTTLIPMLDIEAPYPPLTDRFDSCWNMTGTISTWIRSFVSRIQARIGRPPLIYTSASWWNTCTGSDSSFGGYPLDVADWTHPQPSVPAGWSNFTFWQYAPGDPTVEGSYDSVVFNGELDSLATFAGGSRYTPTSPTRMLDTRYGVGTGGTAPVGPGASISLQVTGVAGVPTTGVTAAVFNVTVTKPTANGYLTVYPDGQAQPNVSNLNFTAGKTIPNLVSVAIINGKVKFSNGSSGTIHVLADLAGYYSTEATGSGYTPMNPTRLLDTRSGSPVGPGSSISLLIAGVGGVPASGVTAVVLNVTVTRSTAGGYLTVYPDGQAQPNVSNLNFTTGQTIPNLVSVAVVNGSVDFYNGSPGTVHVLADLAGYYSDEATGSRYIPRSPTRMLDTRYGLGSASATPVGPGSSISLQVAGAAGVPANGVTAVVLNVTATGPTANGYLTVYPDGQAQPNASNLNFVATQTIPNLVMVAVVNGRVNFYNGSTGTVHVLADLAGYYY